MTPIRLAILVYDGERLLVDLAAGRDLPGLDVPTGDGREDEEILAEHGPAATGLPVSGFSFLDSVYVHRGTGYIVNLYHARSVEGALPLQAPAGFAWSTLEELARSAVADEVLKTLDVLITGTTVLAPDDGDPTSWRTGNGRRLDAAY